MREQRVFALMVANYRSENGLSQREMAIQCDISFQIMTAIEAERAGSTWKTICKVLRGMDMSFADFNSYLQTCEFFKEDGSFVKVTVDKVKCKMQLKIHRLEEQNAMLRFEKENKWA